MVCLLGAFTCLWTWPHIFDVLSVLLHDARSLSLSLCYTLVTSIWNFCLLGMRLSLFNVVCFSGIIWANIVRFLHFQTKHELVCLGYLTQLLQPLPTSHPLLGSQKHLQFIKNRQRMMNCTPTLFVRTSLPMFSVLLTDNTGAQLGKQQPRSQLRSFYL